MRGNNYTHVAFADESNWNKGKYRSISLVTAGVDDARSIHRDLDELRSHYNKKEFKWNKTNGRLGTEIVGLFFKNCKKMRVDVLIWNMDDFRHRGVIRRNDREDFARMYYHLLHNVLRMRWLDNARWFIFPDKQSAMDWRTLKSCLEWKKWSVEKQLFAANSSVPGMNEYYNISGIEPVSSQRHLIVQMADLFAGLSSYSYKSFSKYHVWQSKGAGKQSLFEEAREEISLSKSDRERLPILGHVFERASNMGLQVSLNSTSGLCTHNPTNPLNFWLYQPQRMTDKAPVKK